MTVCVAVQRMASNTAPVELYGTHVGGWRPSPLTMKHTSAMPVQVRPVCFTLASYQMRKTRPLGNSTGSSAWGIS